MRSVAALRVFIPLSIAASTMAVEEKPRPKFQYQSAGIEVPAASADEPRVAAFGPKTVEAARQYLENGALHWVREKSCIACHSTGVYMVERSALTPWLGAPTEEVHANFVEAVPKEGAKDSSPIKSVWRSSGLASWDQFVTGRLSETTDRSLRHTLTLLGDDGAFQPISQVEIPYITTAFELTVQAARAVTTAPGWLQQTTDPVVVERVERMKRFLREHEPISDFELALKLQLSTLMPDLVPPATKASAEAMLWRQQLPDGGWSLRRMSDLMKWHTKMDPKVIALIEGEPDAASPGSDAYMTAWAIVLLREAGAPASDPRIQKGVAWLQHEQRETGRWWMKSLYRGTYHYSTYISTAQALRALALCGKLPAPAKGS